jgi:hypothetical protein
VHRVCRDKRGGTTIALLFVVRIRELLLSIAGITLLILLLALADGRVRERLGDATPAALSQEVAQETSRVASITVTARDLAVDSAPLTLLVIASTVLVAFMLRT